MPAIDHLLAEHPGSMSQIAERRRGVRDRATRGAAPPPEALPVLPRLGRLMETQLAAQARKEDEGLFPMAEQLLDDERLEALGRDFEALRV